MKQRCFWFLTATMAFTIVNGFIQSNVSFYQAESGVEYRFMNTSLQQYPPGPPGPPLPMGPTTYTYYAGFKCFLYCMYTEPNIVLCPEINCRNRFENPRCLGCVNAGLTGDMETCTKECVTPGCPNLCVIHVKECMEVCASTDCPGQPCWLFGTPCAPSRNSSQSRRVNLCYRDLTQIHPLGPETSFTWIYITVGVVFVMCMTILIVYMYLIRSTSDREPYSYRQTSARPARSTSKRRVGP